MKKTVALLSFLAINCFSGALLAQKAPDDIATVNDKFQESFYESLKQKAIENYDKAISALEVCEKMQPENAVILYELGKNYQYQKEYQKAFGYYDRASKIDSKNRWYLNGKYESAYRMNDFQTAIETVGKLIELQKEYREDLVVLYIKTAQYQKALDLINVLNDEVGKSEKREMFKFQILKDSRFQGSEITNLLDLIKKNPKEESNYLELINLYNASNQDDKALEIANKLEAAIPTSDWVQVDLFRTYLKNGQNDLAIASLNKALSSSKIDRKVKHKLFNEFLIFVKHNPQYNPDLERAIAYLKDDKEVKVAKEVGKFFQSKKQWDNAIRYYELDKTNNPNDIETQILLVECYVAKEQYDAVLKNADSSIELFPMQPEFYYYSGLANNQLKNYKKAQQILEQGLDYLVEDKELETNFYIQLGEAYNALGDNKKKEFYFKKADGLLK